MPEPQIETARLIGVPLTEGEFTGMRLLHTDPRVMATLSADGKLFAEAQTRDFLARSEEHWRRYRFGLWAFHERATGTFVGCGGLRHTIVEGDDEVELAYAVRSNFWHRGFATEMSSAALKDGGERMQLDLIVAFTLPSNVASRRVMEKLGFKYERDIVHAALAHVLYRFVPVGPLIGSR
ncbi:MAG TPA: GNAT family N-acetyltransferase [Candidatus Binataceae bacterium]|nr:GNAT family N-acetyltransferase [Candidatus Binataceae bacterium]